MNLSGKTCLFDTNILVAHINRSHVHHAQAVAFFDQTLTRDFRAVISSQNLLELTAVLVHGFRQTRRQVAEDVELVRKDGILDVIYPDERSIENFFQLLKENVSLHTSDLFLLATAVTHKVDVIVSGDRDFQKVPPSLISIYNPFVAN